MVPTTGLEPVRCYSLEPESSASANSATWATPETKRIGAQKTPYFRRFSSTTVFSQCSPALHLKPPGQRPHSAKNRQILEQPRGWPSEPTDATGFLRSDTRKTTAEVTDQDEAPGGGPGAQNETAGALGTPSFNSRPIGAIQSDFLRIRPQWSRGFSATETSRPVRRC